MHTPENGKKSSLQHQAINNQNSTSNKKSIIKKSGIGTPKAVKNTKQVQIIEPQETSRGLISELNEIEPISEEE